MVFPPSSLQIWDAVLFEDEWALVAPLIPPPKPCGHPPVHPRREIVNALAYWVRAGCAWRLLPQDLPPRQMVYHYGGPRGSPACGNGY
ncbi:transposase [Spirillospora sp. NPDC052269]